MRLWKKKFYREVECKRCAGSGKVSDRVFYLRSKKDLSLKEIHHGLLKTCDACNGKGTQTVLEREE